MAAHTFYADYLECAREARAYATAMQMDVSLRKVKEYGRSGYTFNLRSRDGSDHLAETILPNEPQS